MTGWNKLVAVLAIVALVYLLGTMHRTGSPIESKTTVVMTDPSPFKVVHSVLTTDSAKNLLGQLEDAENLRNSGDRQKIVEIMQAIRLAVASNPALDGSEGYCKIDLIFQGTDDGKMVTLSTSVHQDTRNCHILAKDVDKTLNGAKTGELVRVLLVPDSPYYQLFPIRGHR